MSSSLIKKVKASNFLSWEKLEFDVSQGITLLEGFNFDDQTSEGSGKSAILNAICWGLFGKLPKDASVDSVVRVGTKSCKVEVFLSDGTVVTRSRSPNEVYIVLSDEIGNTYGKKKGKDAKETQVMIDKLLGLGFETFCQSVYFAQNYQKKFITSNEEDKAKILSEILDLEVFTRARKLAHDKLKDAESKIEAESAQLQSLWDRRQVLEANILHLKQVKDRMDREKLEKLRELASSLAAKSAELQALDSSYQNLGDSGELNRDLEIILSEKEKIEEEKISLRAAIASATSKKTLVDSLRRQALSLQAEIAELELEAERYRNPKDKKCKACGSLLERADPNHFKTHVVTLEEKKGALLAKKSELEKDAVKVDSEIPDATTEKQQLAVFQNKISELSGVERKIRSDLASKDIAESKIQSLGNSIEELKKNISEEEMKNFDYILEKNTNNVTSLEIIESSIEKTAEARSKLELLSSRLGRLKEGYREVRALVFRGTLLELNTRTNKYLRDLFEVPVGIDFSNEGEEGETSKIITTVTWDGVDRPLGLYSGGQFRRIQLAVDLALADLVSSRSFSSFNLRIFDEYFKDLSEESMFKVLKLLEKLSGSVLLIEHNSVLKSAVQESFKIELREGISREVS
jgi:DNA repair exonuclease SbcCD ATPase subunit